MRETHSSRELVGEGGIKGRDTEEMKEKRKDERKKDESNDL